MRPASGWTSIVLVGLMMLTVAWSIESADYAPGLDILAPIVVGGVLTGALLGAQQWLPSSLAHGWSIVIGLFVTGTLGTRTLEVYAGARTLADSGLADRIALVRDWYVAWLTAAVDGALMGEELVQFAFVITMALLLWLLSYICTWFVVRYVSWWGAVLPSGFALLFNLHQAPPERLTGLAFYLICALLLAEQTHVALQIDRWERERIGFTPGINLAFLRDGLVVALVVVAAAWTAPERVSSEPLRRALGEMLQNTPRDLEQRLSRVFPGPSFPSRGGGTSFGTSMPLGGSVSLGTQAIFEARVAGAETAPRYWRMAVFDRYDGAGWYRTPGEEIEGEGLDLRLAAAYALTTAVTQTVRVFQSGAEQLYALPQPDGFDLPVRIEVAASGSERDVLAAWSRAPLGVGQEYTAISLQSIADEERLRGARDTDPSWVTAAYLQLPATVPTRVRELAAAVTAGAPSRYDAAQSIETFLRGEYVYSEEINAPPVDRDRVDWFLFDERRGYCDYYSSAFVVLARSVGIPARLAAGYSTGEYVAETASFRQHEYDAHTWPEVFLPGFGWIEFEPTAGDARIDRPSPQGADEMGATEDPVPDRPDPAELDDELPRDIEAPATEPSGRPEGTGRSLGAVVAVLGALATAGLGLSLGYWAWRRPYAGLTVAEGAFARLTRVARWLGLAPRPSDTPGEFGIRLSGAIPQRRADIATIVDAYVRERFGRRPALDRSDALAAAWAHVRREVPAALGRIGARRLRDR